MGLKGDSIVGAGGDRRALEQGAGELRERSRRDHHELDERQHTREKEEIFFTAQQTHIFPCIA